MRYILDVTLWGSSDYAESIDYSKTHKDKFEVSEQEAKFLDDICMDRGIPRDRLWCMSLYKEFDSVADALETEDSCSVVHFKNGDTKIKRKFIGSEEIR